MLKNDIILITGGGSGIGEALALQLANENKVVICGRNEAKLKMVAAKNKNISYETADVSDYNSIDKLFSSLKEKGIVFNVLINNAGVVELWEMLTTLFTSKEIFEKVNTNLSGAIAVTQLFIHQANHSVENLIVNVTSEIALFPIPILPLYATSKAGLRVFTQSLRVQLKNTKFKVVEILPPAVDTAMPKQLNNTGKLLNVNSFVNGVIKCIVKGNTEYSPGENILLLKMFSKFFPKAGLNLIDKMSRKQLLG
jgi:uncharacterized oxidoreductase